ncbi:MAG: HEAT repeat domain-containing protein [Polyangia bacterium]
MSLCRRRVFGIPGAVWLLLALGALACKRPSVTSRPSLWLGPVAITSTAGDASLLVDREALAQKVRAQLLQAGIFDGEAEQSPRPGAAVARVRITVSAEVVRADGKAAARAGVGLNVSTRPEGVAPSHFGEDVQAGAEMPCDPAELDKRGIMQRLAERAVGDLLAAYIARQKLWSAKPESVHAALVTPGEMRLEAIRVTAARKLRDESPSLVALLADDDETTRDAALGALVQLRDPSAVPALTKGKSMKDRREMRKIVDALAALGGQEAVDYLSFVADAHEDEEIRNLAQAALARMGSKNSGRAPIP